MRVLTVRQPWAWAIIHGGKDVENRSRNIAGAYRGPVAIHVAQTIAHDVMVNPGPALAAAARDYGRRRTDPVEGCPWYHHTGAIIGVVDLVDVHRHDGLLARDPWACTPWAMPDHHHLTLAAPRALEVPIPATGRLGLWTLDDPRLDALAAT